VSRRPLASIYLGGEAGAPPLEGPASRLSVVAA
jgi:hypothetical protein